MDDLLESYMGIRDLELGKTKQIKLMSLHVNFILMLTFKALEGDELRIDIKT